MKQPPSEGTTYWKSFEELAREPDVMEQLGREFDKEFERDSDASSSIPRRTFMGLLAASIALAGAGCRRPEQQIVPYVKKPEYLVPGIANHFATSFVHGNFASGVLVRSREGRPVKIEGNDLDPISRGKSSVFAQASLLALYDPDRTLRPTVNNSDSTPQNAISRMAKAMREVSAKGKKIRVVVDEHASPSLAALFRDVESTMPNTKVISWPALTRYGAPQANEAVLGFPGVLVPDLSKAQVIVGIDSDFLGTDEESLYHIRNFSTQRKPSKESPAMSRYYAVEANASLTGSNADHRIQIAPHEMDAFLLALLHELVLVRGKGNVGDTIRAQLTRFNNSKFTLIKKIADDLVNKQGVVMIGKHLPANTHVLGILVNKVIGAIGEGMPIDPAHALPYSSDKTHAIQEFQKELNRGDVGVVLFAGVNPAYSLPASDFRSMMSKVLYKFSASMYADETSKVCQIFIPTNHYLESWGDAVALDGSLSIVQPLIAPLNEDQLSLGDMLLRLMDEIRSETKSTAPTYYNYIRTRWEKEVFPVAGSGSFHSFWIDALKKGTVAMPSNARSLTFNQESVTRAISDAEKPAPSTRGVVLGILPSASVYDGRFANLGWLQELPDPVTKVTWDNVALMSKATADVQGFTKGDIVRITSSKGSIELPVYIQPGVADNVIFTSTGYGRREGGRVLDGVGKNVFELIPTGESTLGYFSVTLRKTGKTYRIATTQNYFSLGGSELYGIDRSDIVKEGTLGAFVNNPKSLFENDQSVDGAKKQQDKPISLVPDYDYSKGHRWGMTIDASACVGCNACVVACVAENNIPVVGKEQVLKGRHLHWIRIDRYYNGDPANPNTLVQPMLCQHCENAPCENVCPVAATTHSPEGINEMTYNRCVGTRYCSNNCPYKVRRFNFLNYHKDEREPQMMVYNPDVTVRQRGVMEKCTFCIHRINEAKYHAKNEGRDLLHDGEVVTACQQACPADAITFGNMNDPDSALSKQRESDRGYLVLRELNVRPSITYLAKIRNTSGEHV